MRGWGGSLEERKRTGFARILLATIGGLAVLAASPWTVGAGSTSPECRPVSYHSAPNLQAQRVCMNLGVATHGTEPGTYLFLTPGGSSSDGVGIFRDTGALVWWHPAGDPRVHDASVIDYNGQPYLAVFSGHPASAGPYDSGTVSLYNEHYQKVGTITAGRPFSANKVDLHEFRLTSQGNALIGITDPVRRVVNGRSVTVIQYVIQEISLVHDSQGIHTGRVIFQWTSLPHVPVTQTYAPYPGPGVSWDYFHGNSIAQDSDGNLIVSARNTWSIYKINVKTGRIMWQVGGRGDRTLRKPWCWQHDAVSLGHNEYSLLDDSSFGSPCQSGGRLHPARGVIIRVDPSQHPAAVHLVRAYAHRPAIHPLVAGSVQRLDGGDVLVDWGQTPNVTEFGAGGNLKMDLLLSAWSYRGVRFAWDGKPLTLPAISAQDAGNSTTIWASWNGSTEVAAWQALAGASPSTLRPVGNPVPKRSFETSIALDRRYATVRVRALDARGRVLAASAPATTR